MDNDFLSEQRWLVEGIDTPENPLGETDFSDYGIEFLRLLPVAFSDGRKPPVQVCFPAFFSKVQIFNLFRYVPVIAVPKVEQV